VLVPMFIFICFSAATATAENLQTIMITRFFAGVMASSPVVTVGGGIAVSLQSLLQFMSH